MPLDWYYSWISSLALEFSIFRCTARTLNIFYVCSSVCPLSAYFFRACNWAGLAGMLRTLVCCWGLVWTPVSCSWYMSIYINTDVLVVLKSSLFSVPVVSSKTLWCVTNLLFWLINCWFVVSSFFVLLCFMELFFIFAPVTVCAGGGFASPLPQRNRWSNVYLGQTLLLMCAPAVGYTETVIFITASCAPSPLVESCWDVF